MNTRRWIPLAAAALCAALLAQAAPAATGVFESELLGLQHDWAHANYEVTRARDRKAAFEAVVERAQLLAKNYASEVAAVAWQGIVLSTYAGEVSAFSAMKYARAAKESLERALEMDPEALDGGIYASLGALYSKVPGGMMGFGDDEIAREYFEKAMRVSPDNIDNNFFFAEFLLEHDETDRALSLLNAALAAPVTADRPVFDAGRRAEIAALIESAND